MYHVYIYDGNGRLQLHSSYPHEVQAKQVTRQLIKQGFKAYCRQAKGK